VNQMAEFSCSHWVSLRFHGQIKFRLQVSCFRVQMLYSLGFFFFTSFCLGDGPLFSLERVSISDFIYMCI